MSAAQNPFAQPFAPEAFAPEPAPAPAAGQAAAAAPALSLTRAMTEARRAVAVFTELPVDAVAACTPEGAGWRVEVDVVESRARMGDNDLLATFEVGIAPSGEVTGFRRLGRYLRDDAPRRDRG